MLLELLKGTPKLSAQSQDRSLWGDFWFTKLWQSRKTEAGINVDQDVAKTYAAVWCASLCRAGAISAMPKHVYLKQFDAKIGRNRRVVQDGHPAQKLLHVRPNNDMTPLAYHFLMEEWRLNAGNAYAEIEWERDRSGRKGVPIGLHPIHPYRVERVRAEDGRWVYEIKGLSEPVFLEPEDVIHIPSIFTRDGITGIGVIENARETIGGALATEKQGSKESLSGYMPKAVVTQTMKGMDPDQRKDFRREWREIHTEDGFDVAILPPGQDIKPLTISARDQMFIERQVRYVLSIAQWYNIPPHFLHQDTSNTHKNLEQISIELVQYGLLPWIIGAEQEYSHKLGITRDGLYLKYEVDGLKRGDMESRSKFYHSGITDGWMAPNDAAEWEDLEPFVGGNTHFIQGAMAPILEDGELGSTLSEQQSDDPVEQPDAEESAPQAKVRAVAAKVVHEALSKMVAIEANTIRRVAKKGVTEKWMEDYYGGEDGFERKLAAAMAVPMEAAALCGVTETAANVAREHVRDSRRELLEQIKMNAASPQYDALVGAWEQNRSQTTLVKLGLNTEN